MSERSHWYRIGHTSHLEDCTGCTVVVFDGMPPAVADVRGGAPGTREIELLQPGRQVGKVNAIVLTGGSAFGLAAADGVVRWLAEQGIGFPTRFGPVPIVPGAVIFDLGFGEPRHVLPDDGYAAARSATYTDRRTGRVGAGSGATVAKLGGAATPGGLGIATVRVGDNDVTAIVVLNALGDIRDPETGRWLARATDPSGARQTGREMAVAAQTRSSAVENTTIGIVLIDGAASRDAMVRCAISAHDALARCVVPAHTLFDGDTFFVVAQSEGSSSPGEILALASATEIAVERAIVGLFPEPLDES